MFPGHGRFRDRPSPQWHLVPPFLLVCGVVLVAFPPRVPTAQAKSRLSASVRDANTPAKAKRPKAHARNTFVCIVNVNNNQRVINAQVQNNTQAVTQTVTQKVVTVEKVVVVPHYVTVTKVLYVPRYITKVVYVPRYMPAPTATPYDPAAAPYNTAVAQYNTATAPYAAPTPTDTPVPYPPVAYP